MSYKNISQTVFLLFFSILLANNVNSQIIGAYYAKEFNKDISLYKAKIFLVEEVFTVGENSDPIPFNVDPLAAASSGELTTLIYNCPQKNKKGLILGFYGEYWDDGGSGVNFIGYKFKNLPEDIALKLLTKIDKEMSTNEAYLSKDLDKNNIYFKFDDMVFIITKPAGLMKIRVLWNGFDSEWEETAFNRTKRRYLKKSK